MPREPEQVGIDIIHPCRGRRGSRYHIHLTPSPPEGSENAETAISCKGPGPAGKKKKGVAVVARRGQKMQTCVLVATQ